MRKGLVYSFEAVFIASVLLVLFTAVFSMALSSNPNYGLTDSMKVAHDMGQANTSDPPAGFNYSDGCSEGVNLDVYSFNGTADSKKLVCVRGIHE